MKLREVFEKIATSGGANSYMEDCDSLVVMMICVDETNNFDDFMEKITAEMEMTDYYNSLPENKRSEIRKKFEAAYNMLSEWRNGNATV